MPVIRTASKAAESFHEGAYVEYVDAVAASLENDFEYSPITALEFARDDFKDITKACYSATKDPKEAAKEIDAKYMGGNESRKKAEGHEGWDGWEEVEGLEDSIEGIENLAYELRHCIRGAKTQCKDWKALALYIKGLASNLEDAAGLMAYRRDEDESKKKNGRNEGLGSWEKAVVKELVKKYKFSPGWAEICVDGDWKGLVSKYLLGNKSPEECAKAINASGANESFEAALKNKDSGEIVYKYEVTGFNWGDMNNTKPITDTVVLHFSDTPVRKEANQMAIAEFEKKHSDCYGDTTKLLDIQNIKENHCLAEDVVKVMGHYIPEGIWTAIKRFDNSNTDQRQTGFFGSAEMKKRYIDFTNSMAQYIEQNIKKADPKEQGFIANNLKKLKTERDSLVSKLMVMKGRRNEGLTNFRFKTPETMDDLIGIEDFICEVYRRNKGEDAVAEIQQRIESLQNQAVSQYAKEKGPDAWDKLKDAACAQFLFNAIRSIVKDITQEDFSMVYTSPGTDREYLQEVVLCDKEVQPPEYRADDMFDFTSLRKSEGSFTDTFRIQYLDEFDPEYSGKEVLIEGTGTDRASAREDAIRKFYDDHPDAEIHAVR